MQEIHGSVIDQTNSEKDGDNQNQNVDVRRMVCRYRLSSLLPRRALLIKRLRERATENIAEYKLSVAYRYKVGAALIHHNTCVME
ncbi:hypothetical protein KQX54_006558 [Cotesia glomerata]|uniref:Uncharacterized protein n=1 Tax=Cotesia glomerata TaxID=32391 RepID=A0AAV7J655_COTGL|nr:hypothetical protein KQX54_006558 [Cotesia glomerata]